MCIFFGELVQNCEHAECQIVSTIRSLNETKLFKDNKSLPGGEEQRQQKIVSIANMVEEEGLHDPVYKVEEQEPASLGYQVEEPDASKSELYRRRVQSLQMEVRELKSMIYWMKGELEKKGLLS